MDNSLDVSRDVAQLRARLQCSNPGCECHREGGRLHCPAHDDKNPDLSLTEGNSAVIWHCFAGCSKEAVTEAIKQLSNGSTPARPPRPTLNGKAQPKPTKPAAHQEKPKHKEKPIREKDYPYTDAAGGVLYKVIRKDYPTETKYIRPYHQDAHGEWIEGRNNIPAVLYRLPEVLQARRVYIVEGEEKAEVLRAKLLEAGETDFAVTTSGSSTSWQERFADDLKDKEIIIWGDNDPPGQNYAAKILATLEGKAGSIKIIRPPNLPTDGGDAVDFFEQGGTVPLLRQIIEQTNEYGQEPPKPLKFVFKTHIEAKNSEPPEFIIEGFLPESRLTAITGKYESLKTTAAASILYSLATGTEWYGRRVQQMPIAYICGEDASGFVSRATALEIANGQEFPYYLLDEAPNMLSEGDAAELLRSIDSLPEKPGIIVLDTLARCMVGGDENSAREMGMLVDNAEKLRRATGATILIIHHTGKNGDGARGSTALPGAVDTIIKVERSNDIATVSCEKQKNAERFTPIGLRKVVVELGGVDQYGQPRTSIILRADRSAVEAGKLSKADDTRERVLAILAKHPEGLRPSQWQEAAHQAIGCARSTFYGHVEALETGGQIIKKGYEWLIVKNSPVCPVPSSLDEMDGIKQSSLSNHPIGVDKVDNSGLDSEAEEWEGPDPFEDDE